MWLIILCVLLIIFVIAAVFQWSLEKKIKYQDLKNKHVVITGGSSGIGKAAAVELIKLGAHVTIIGRNVEKLKSATNELASYIIYKNEQKIQYASVDVTMGYESIQTTFCKLEQDIGPIFMLINCAGMCICGQFENMDVDHIKQMIDLNYFGTAYPTRYVLPGMKKRREGIIVFVSTEAALIGIYGYSAYGSAKWAVRGLAESLMMELIGTGVRLTLVFPPDTDTPGFQTEELTKPEETKLISDMGGLHSAEEVGRKLVQDALVGKSYSVFGFSGHLMSLLYCGSVDSVSQVFIQVFSMGFLRIIMVGVILSFYKIVRNGLKKKRGSGDNKTK